MYRETIGKEPLTPEEAAREYNVSVEAVLEAIDYCVKNKDLRDAERRRKMLRSERPAATNGLMLPQPHEKWSCPVSKEIYVMPLWRFKVGDFATSVEANLGLKPKIVTADGIEERPASIGWFQRWRARWQVRSIRRAVERVNTGRLDWNDAGPVVYSQQTIGMEALRAYARWLDCRDQLGRFDPAPSGNYYQHPVWQTPLVQLTCPHLVGHDCYNGYYLASDFDRIIQVEPYRVFGAWPATRSVGSSVRLLRELGLLQEHLAVDDDYEFPQHDLLLPVKRAFFSCGKLRG